MTVFMIPVSDNQWAIATDDDEDDGETVLWRSSSLLSHWSQHWANSVSPVDKSENADDQRAIAGRDCLEYLERNKMHLEPNDRQTAIICPFYVTLLFCLLQYRVQ